MRNHNSRMTGFYTGVLVSIYHDLVSAILPQNEIERDIEEIRRRALHEGITFFTKVLPALGKSIDVSLASGAVLTFTGFRKGAGTKLPRFLAAVFKTVFRDDGVPWFATWYSDHKLAFDGNLVMDATRVATENDVCDITSFHRQIQDLLAKRGKSQMESFPGLHILKEIGLSRQAIDHISLGIHKVAPPFCSDAELNSRREAMVVALRILRQVCFAFYKLNLPFTDEQKSKTLEDFCSVDQALDFQVERLSPENTLIHREARRLICRVLANADCATGIPRHGPGAVATGEKSPEKHLFRRYYERLAAVFRYDEWFFLNQSHVCDSFTELQSFETIEAGTAKVVLVPKDSRGPRLISCEPLEYQWIQQSLMRILVDTIQSHPLTKGFVNFTNQNVNRDLARKASRSFKFVTLDMKEASDRVDLELVRTMFPDRWYEHLYASRSASTRLPNGTVVHLKKFAPMGSAVCFPVEALIFWALSVAALIVKHNLPPRKAATKVYVYGDDIICDAAYHGALINTLPAFGLMLNQGKCCIAGPFKESCGMDAFYGHSVTPTRFRSMWVDRPTSSSLASYVEYSNAFYRDGLFETAWLLERCIQGVLKAHRMHPIPTVSGGNPSCLAFVRPNELAITKNRSIGAKIRFNPDRQYLEVMGYRLQSKQEIAKTYGWPFLLRKLAEMEAKSRYTQLESIDACSLPTGHYPIAHRVKLKRAWTPAI